MDMIYGLLIANFIKVSGPVFFTYSIQTWKH